MDGVSPRDGPSLCNRAVVNNSITYVLEVDTDLNKISFVTALAKVWRAIHNSLF